MTEENQVSEEKSFAEQLQEEFAKYPTPEEQLAAILVYMKKTIAQEGEADFKGFWEARKLCLEIFKKPLPSSVHANRWQEYIDISQEARRLKDILDEQTAFAIEQIELAIQSLEADLQKKKRS